MPRRAVRKPELLSGKIDKGHRAQPGEEGFVRFEDDAGRRTDQSEPALPVIKHKPQAGLGQVIISSAVRNSYVKNYYIKLSRDFS